jgi:hypothetical protein
MPIYGASYEMMPSANNDAVKINKQLSLPARTSPGMNRFSGSKFKKIAQLMPIFGTDSRYQKKIQLPYARVSRDINVFHFMVHLQQLLGLGLLFIFVKNLVYKL